MFLSNLQATIAKNITKRNLVIIVGIIIAVEASWGVWTLTKSTKTTAPVRSVAVPAVKKDIPTVISLQAPKETLKVGEKVTVAINLSSTKYTDGTDLIILYDPKLLSVDPTTVKSPIKTTSLYPEYPVNAVDSVTGRITASGIASQSGGVIPEGLFGSVTFIAKATGKASVLLDFTPGSTSDSNVVESKTAKDVLDQVNNLEFTILP